MPRRVLQGAVVSNKGDKTIVVRVESTSKHPIYGKIMRTSKKFSAHDETNQCHIGDVVEIIECPPHSKTKCFDLHKVVKSAGELVTDTASDVQA